MSNDTLVDADRELKARHRAMWALGDYPAVAVDLVAELGTVLVAAAAITAGDQVLDVAAGSGNAAIPAAARGADVLATDLTPELMEAGRRIAERTGTKLQWQEADAEALPFPDNGYDVVMSCLGVMFAPHHQASADELVRVCRPGGRIALLSWTPEGFIGQMFAVMKPYAPVPPPGVQPPPLWGSEDHVGELLGERVEAVEAERRMLVVDGFAGPEAFRDYFKANYGPTIATYRAIAADPDKVQALDAALVDLARRSWDDARGGMAWEYLVLVARVR
jgi:ubiquinone/menaquinone biosynthesis C-methylase UbiE